MTAGGTLSRDDRRGPIVHHTLRRARLRALGVLAAAALVVTVDACAGGGRPSGPPDAGLPFPQGVIVSVGVDGDGSFYSFTSSLDPDLALAAYSTTLEAAGFADGGTARGWEQFSDGQRTLAVRAEPGPPTLVLVREVAVAGGSGTPADPTATTPPASPAPGSPVASDQPPGGTTTATPRPTPPGRSETKPGRKPDPPHGTSTGIGNGNGNPGGNGKGNPGGNGKGNAGGAKPDPTPRPTKSPKP